MNLHRNPPFQHHHFLILFTTISFIINPQTQCASSLPNSCATYRDCNPFERCLTSGYCHCKFGYIPKLAPNYGNPKRKECSPFACVHTSACEREYGSNTICERFHCRCVAGAFVDEETQQCVSLDNLKQQNKTSNEPKKFRIWQWNLRKWKISENETEIEEAADELHENLSIKCSSDWDCERQ